MILLTPVPLDDLEESAKDEAIDAALAREAGATLYYLPSERLGKGRLAEAIEHIPKQSEKRKAVWKGTIPSFGYYKDVFRHLAAKNIFLVNSPEQHLEIFEFDLAYPKIKEVTPKSFILTSPDQAAKAIEELGLPVFVKGALLSFKHMDWKACVADSKEKLEELSARLLKNPYFSRGRVVVREWAPLIHQVVASSSIPAAKEFRFFVYQGKIISYGYYWPYLLPFSTLEDHETEEVFALVEDVASRFEAPFVSIDAGQLESGKWIVIETGDPQFSGTSLMPTTVLWERMTELLS